MIDTLLLVVGLGLSDATRFSEEMNKINHKEKHHIRFN